MADSKNAANDVEVNDDSEKGSGGGGGLRNARPEVKALAKITGVLDALTEEQRELTLDLVGQTYNRLVPRNGPAAFMTVDILHLRKEAPRDGNSKPSQEEIHASMDRLRKPPEFQPVRNERHQPTPGGYSGKDQIGEMEAGRHAVS